MVWYYRIAYLNVNRRIALTFKDNRLTSETPLKLA